MLGERIIILCLAFGMDFLFGDPPGLWHPVKAMGWGIGTVEKILRRKLKIRDEREADKGKKLFAGCLLVAAVLCVSVSVPALLLLVAARIHPAVRIFVESIMCYQLLAAKSLKEESMKVYDALKEKDLPKAQKAVSMIVGRDTEKLDEQGVIRAAVETVAENTSDGVVAPLFYLFLFGTAGGFFYKAVNTMDSMVGYRNDQYLYLGRPAAKLDDGVNYLPARLAAGFMLLSAFLLGYQGKEAWRIYRRDKALHHSPNAAQTESVCAGALGIRLAGDAWYFGQLCHKPYLGDDKRAAQAEDIKRAIHLMYTTSVLAFSAGSMGLLCWMLIFR